MNTRNVSLLVAALASAALLNLGCEPANPPAQPAGSAASVQPTTTAAATPKPANEGPDERECRVQLEKIHAAIQAYRQDHKDLPEWLTDLVPKYLPDKEILVCPITKRTQRTHSYVHLRDPKLPACYLYEFTMLPMGGIYGGGQVKMRDFKRRQMGFVGGNVPIVRCHLHNPVLNLAFDGHVYTSPLGWEDNFTNVVTLASWEMVNLFPERFPARQAPPVTQPDPASALQGKPAPAINLPLLEGGDFDLASHKGKDIVLLDFWASWCGPCRVAMPVLVEIAKEYKDKGVRYFAINLREDPAVIRKFLANANLELTVPLDKTGGVSEKYFIRGIPTMVVVNKEGVVEKVHVGSSPNLKTDLSRALDDLLAGKKAQPPE